MYLLDTCVISDFLKGDQSTMRRIKSISPSQLFYSPITTLEIQYGLRKNPQKAKQIQDLLAVFLAAITALEFSNEDARVAAEIQYDLSQKGTPIGPYDLLLAATARQHQFILVTANLREFERVAGLVVESWRGPSQLATTSMLNES